MKREPKTRREQAEYVVKRLTDFGVNINPSSRIGKMLQVLREPRMIEPSDSKYPIVLESIRDMYQLRLIVDTMDAHQESKDFRVAVNLIKKGLVLPQDENKDTPGRNYQFQLYFAALCTNSGLPTWHKEPDIICDVEGKMLGIAAKRLKSIKSFEDNIRDAANQIHGTDIPGIIALDLTSAQNQSNRRITSPLESQLYMDLLHTRNHALFQNKEKSIQKIVDGKRVLAICIFQSTLRLMKDQKWSHDCSLYWFNTTQNRTETKLLNQFQKAQLSKIPNPDDHTANES